MYFVKIRSSEPAFVLDAVTVPVKVILSSRLSPVARFAYVALLVYYRDPSRVVPSMGHMADGLNVGRQALFDAVHELEKASLVKVARGENDSREIVILPIPAEFRDDALAGEAALALMPFPTATMLKRNGDSASRAGEVFRRAYAERMKRPYIWNAAVDEPAARILSVAFDGDDSRMMGGVKRFLSDSWVRENNPGLSYMAKTINRWTSGPKAGRDADAQWK